jgi:hypothetical protein
MDKKSPIDSINVLLEECIMAYPVSSFIISLYKQYGTRGSLSKKQLQGLYDKASKIQDLAPGKLAAVEVIIKRMPTRNKIPPPVPKPLYEKDNTAGVLIDALLAEYPSHKRVLYLKSKYDNHETLTPMETDDLKRMARLLVKKE